MITEEEKSKVLAQAVYDKSCLRRWNTRNAGYWVNELTEIPLTDQEAADAIARYEKLKDTKNYFDDLVKEKRKVEKQMEEDLIREWDYAKFFKLMRYRHQATSPDKFIYNEQNQLLVKAICFRLSNDTRYETELGLSFSKGVIIRGAPGLGKSYLLGLVADNPVNNVQLLSMHEIAREVVNTGEFLGIKYGSFRYIYLDDVGTEENPQVNFGTKHNFFRTYIEETYAKSKITLGRVILSTNDNFQTLEDKYGFRVRERLAECFDVIDIEGTSLRRK